MAEPSTVPQSKETGARALNGPEVDPHEAMLTKLDAGWREITVDREKVEDDLR